MTKRLHLLDLSGNSTNLWLPANESTAPTNTPAFPVATAPAHASETPFPVQQDEFMDIEDTAHKVWIHDLDAELASVGDGVDGVGTDNVIFIPDIEKKLNKIPRHVLVGRKDEDDINLELLEGAGQLILYNVPTSLTVPTELDGVRKAIIESRARAREKSSKERERNGMESTSVLQNAQETVEDAMDMDL